MTTGNNQTPETTQGFDLQSRTVSDSCRWHEGSTDPEVGESGSELGEMPVG